MNNIEFKFVGNLENKVVFIDDKVVNLKKNKYGSRVLTYQTEKSEINLTVVEHNELASKFWLFWQMLFYLISIFGLFTGFAKPKTAVGALNAKLTVSENCKFIVRLKPLKANNEYGQIESENAFTITQNQTEQNLKLKKRAKILKWCKLLTWLVAIAAVIIIVVL